jgi:hypothetical protein
VVGLLTGCWRGLSGPRLERGGALEEVTWAGATKSTSTVARRRVVGPFAGSGEIAATVSEIDGSSAIAAAWWCSNSTGGTSPPRSSPSQLVWTRSPDRYRFEAAGVTGRLSGRPKETERDACNGRPAEATSAPAIVTAFRACGQRGVDQAGNRASCDDCVTSRSARSIDQSASETPSANPQPWPGRMRPGRFIRVGPVRARRSR